MLALSGIGQLVTNDNSIHGDRFGVINDAAVVFEDGLVSWVGESKNVADHSNVASIDVAGRAVIPGFVDSHTHLAFAGDRLPEFEARMAGRPYSAGGIHATVEATRAASDEQIIFNVERLAAEALRSGTTTMEVKSGYGLSVRDEVRSLVAARTATSETTFLGAHVVPSNTNADDYVALVCAEMLSACTPFSKWIDVFCDRGAFDVDQARQVLSAGKAAGLGLRIHANQLQHGDGVRLGVELGAASCDHCTHLTDADIDSLAGAHEYTAATLLPVAELCTRSEFPNARRLIDAGVTVALATDCNPGSSYSTSMQLVISLAVINMGMTPDEALWSATAGGAAALRRTDIGQISPGKRADVVVLNAPSHSYLSYRPGVQQVQAVVRGGALVAGQWPVTN